MNDPTYIAHKLQDSRRLKPDQLLRGLLMGERIKDCNKALVLLLDDDDCYDVSFHNSGMSASQCIALCEVAKTLFLIEMGFVEEGE